MPPKPDRTPVYAMLALGGPLIDALEEMPVPMWVADRQGQIRWLNRAAASLLGPAVGSHFSRYIAPTGVADARRLFARRMDGEVDSTLERTTLLTAHGPAEVELASAPIRVGSELVGVIALFRSDRPAREAGRRPKPRLTPRQQEVLELLADGHSTAEMSKRLNISEDTLRNHVRFLLVELRVRTRLEAVVTALRNEWL